MHPQHKRVESSLHGRPMGNARQEIRTFNKSAGIQEQASFSPKGLELTCSIYET